MKFLAICCAFWGAVAAAVFAVRPGARIHNADIQTVGRPQRILAAVLLAAMILLCVLPMALPPCWNGTIPGHREQYEQMTESILKGRIDYDFIPVDPKLLEMDNPYDPAERQELNVSYPWDYAYYKGHYYMYFGVVPVFLVFLPYRVLTGTTLHAYHATQVFTALFVAGVFALFYRQAKKFFPAMPWSVWAALSAAFSAMSVWYIVEAPALYCTAIASALCLEIWSLYCFAMAVWDGDGGRRSVLFGMLGSLLGALSFGCRPTVALANLLAVPLLISYLKGKRWNRRLLGQIAAVALPYLVVAALLMLYNYARFENPFEFGQRYQLTIADQTAYGFSFSLQELWRLTRAAWEGLFALPHFSDNFPYLEFGSALANFPLCAASLLLLFPKSRALLREKGLTGFVIVLALLPFIISFSQAMMSPYLLERYHQDLYWLLGLLAFVAVGVFCQTAKMSAKSRRILAFVLVLASYCTLARAFLFWMLPNDANFTESCPEYFQRIAKVLTFGHLY